MFTDRFIKVPASIYNSKIKDLTGKEDGMDCIIRVLPMEIYEYHESVDENERPGVIIYLKGGENFMVYLTIDEFELVLNNYIK